MPPAGYPAFLQYLQSGRVRKNTDCGQSSLDGSNHIRVRRACDDAPLSVLVRLYDACCGVTGCIAVWPNFCGR